MKQEIESREMVEMAVIVLLNGTKSKIAVKDKEGHLKLENHSILTQYLNPYCDRKKMTKKLADTLSLAFQYYLCCSDNRQIDVCARAILFIYAVSSVDLTYCHYDIANEKERTKQETILDLVDALFHAFQGKEKVSRAELQNLVYTTAINRYCYIQTEPAEISIVAYLNIMNAYHQLYDMGMYQLKGNDTKKTFKKYGNFYNFPDFTTSEIFHEKLHKNADKAIDQITDSIDFLSDLLETDNLDAFKHKYPDLAYQILDNPIKDGPKWKEYVFTSHLNPFDFQNWINDLFKELSFTNLYLLQNAYLSYFEEKLSKLQEKYFSRESGKSMLNYNLLNGFTFSQFRDILTNSIRYMQLMARVNVEIGTFGSCHYKKNSVRINRITDMRDLIKIMIEYLFYGVSTKIGKEDENSFTSRKLKEIRSDIVYRYINGKQKKFTNHVRDGLYYRIKYYLYPQERSNGEETMISPQQFGELLWQFFYYAFGTDFYMLRMDHSDDQTRKAYWCELVRMIFSMIMHEGTMQKLEKKVNKKFVELQFKMEEKPILRFTPDEIEFFKQQEILGLTNCDKRHQKAMMGEMSRETFSLTGEIMMRVIVVKIKAILDDAEETKELIFQLLIARSIEYFRYHKEYCLPIGGCCCSNWKYNVYTLIEDGNRKQIAINDTQLDELMQLICTGVMASRTQNLKFDFCETKEKLWIMIKELSKIEYKNYNIFYGESHDEMEMKKFYAVNQEFLEGDRIQRLHFMLQRIYKYLLYTEWIDANLKLVW